MKLKMEINFRERFAVLGFENRGMAIESRWLSGHVTILNCPLDVLHDTKVRAPYHQRRGRDLFDLWTAIASGKPKPEQVIGCFLQYLEKEGHRVSRAEFKRNLLAKLDDPRFIADIKPLVMSPRGVNLPRATELVINRLAPLIPGDPWPGKASS